MNDMEGPLRGADHEAQEQSGVLTAGMMIRNAREASGLHVAALAVAMKIPVKKLEALEADRLDLLHDAVFVRALAASVCRALKVDPAPILQKLPLNTVPRLNADERGINAPFHSPGDSVTPSISELLARPSALIFLALLLGGIAVAFLPDIKETDWSRDFLPSASKAPTDSSVQSLTASEVPNVASAPRPATSTVPNSTVGVERPNPVATTPSMPVASSSAAHQTRGVIVPTADIAGVVVFRAKGPSWIKVVDAKGTVQLSKTLAIGEVVGASGVTPLSITVGRADATDVEVRGRPFDLAGVAKENVARFEVK